MKIIYEHEHKRRRGIYHHTSVGKNHRAFASKSREDERAKLIDDDILFVISGVRMIHTRVVFFVTLCFPLRPFHLRNIFDVLRQLPAFRT